MSHYPKIRMLPIYLTGPGFHSAESGAAIVDKIMESLSPNLPQDIYSVGYE